MSICKASDRVPDRVLQKNAFKLRSFYVIFKELVPETGKIYSRRQEPGPPELNSFMALKTIDTNCGKEKPSHFWYDGNLVGF
jgi:hypothetical protein